MKKIFIILPVIIICTLLLLNSISKKITPIFLKYAEIETKKFTNIVINDAISETITTKAKPEDVFDVITNTEGEIKSVDFNTININKYLTDTTRYIQKCLKSIEKGNITEIKNNIIKIYDKKNLKKGIITYINSGVIFNNPILANLGPKIPIKVNLKGDVISYITAEVDDYGINNSLIKVFINLKVNENIIIPFYNKNIDMEAKVPIAIKLISGKIPEYYMGTKESKQIIIPN
ncbi:MAG: sporulation protein YunB [Bacilli bacterium]|nr:sporulation protein YunB [Bacilli bacterium]